jgi:tRNA wybutosine-synthesizing protein 3
MAGAFGEKKAAILRSLSQPDEDYQDLSPKGTVDEGIRNLIKAINHIPGLVTTSSCAGRVSVFLEAPPVAAEDDGTLPTGKVGKGGKWLFISHDAAELPDPTTVDWRDALGMEDGVRQEFPVGSSLVHLKFEPMVQAAARRQDAFS